MELSISKGSSLYRVEKVWRSSRTPSETESTARSQEELLPRRQRTVKKTTTSMNTVPFRLAKERELTSPRVSPASKKARTSELSPTSFPKSCCGTVLECSGCGNTFVRSDLARLRYGYSGGRRVREKRDEFGNSVTPTSCGSTQEIDGSMDTTGTRPFYSTISKEAGSSSATCSSYSTDTSSKYL